jgi:hypothetical protein
LIDFTIETEYAQKILAPARNKEKMSVAEKSVDR